MKKLLAVFFFLGFLYGPLSGQKNPVDSIKSVIAHPPNDTALVNAWLGLDNLIYMSDPAQDEELNKKISEFSEKKLKTEKQKDLIRFYKSKQLISYNNLGIINMYRSDNAVAKEYFTVAVRLANELQNKEKIAATFNNLGVLYYRQGDYSRSIEYYSKGLSIMESANNYKAMAGALNNIANIYREIGDTAKALTMYMRGLSTGKKGDAKNWQAVSLSSIGEIYASQEKQDSAELLFKEALELDKSIGNKQGVASQLANLSKISLKKGNFDDAKQKADSALMLFKDVHDLRATGVTLGMLGEYYYKKKDISNAIISDQQALDLLMSIGQIQEAESVAGSLYSLYKMKPDYKKALESKEIYDQLHDSLQNEKNTKAVIRQEYKYEYEKQTALDSIKHEVEIGKKDAELKVKRQVQLTLFAGLLLTLIFSIFIYNRFKISKQQNVIIEKQKSQVEQKHLEAEAQRALVEEKNREIVDSINYAKRLQQAILPPMKLVKEFLPESFIIYKPKAIVAGDFYWIERKNNHILFAAADCTGHGVPGAMVSVICNNALNRSLREYGYTEPGKILDKTREIVIQEFEKSEDEVKDGMDISLCSIENNTLRWAGANNPLWIFRKGEMIEYKPNKQPIGKYASQLNFDTHEIALVKGDTIYIFTDGFADQFGGEKGKKFKASNLKTLLLSIQDKDMRAQKEIIDNVFETWKGKYEQVDDVCLIGVRI